jgi:hypothetical protein
MMAPAAAFSRAKINSWKMQQGWKDSAKICLGLKRYLFVDVRATAVKN